MSVYALKDVSCPNCGALRTVKAVDSANPVRHPPFLATLLDRTLNRFTCGCGDVLVIEGPMLWTDVPSGLVAWMLPPDRRMTWPQAEIEVAAGMEGPVRHEGPEFVQAWGRRARIRLVFGLEELREKVVAAINGVDDRVVEILKLPHSDLESGTGPVLERVDEDGLHFARCPVAGSGEPVTPVQVVTWDAYRSRAAIVAGDVDRYPGLFAGTWVHWARAPLAPRSGVGATSP